MIIFNFGAHRSAEDALRLRRMLEQADVFVKEMTTFSAAEQREYEGLLRDLASGNRIALEELGEFSISDYDRVIAEYIYNIAVQRIEAGKRPMRIVLEPYSDKTRSFFCYQKKIAEEAQAAFERGEIREYERLFRRFVDSFVNENIEREKRLGALIDRLCHKNRAAVVLVDVGASHLPLYFEFRRKGHAVRRNFSGMVHDHFEILVRSKTMERFGVRKMNRQREGRLMMQVAVSNTLRAAIAPGITDSIRRMNVAREITNRLNARELVALFGEIHAKKPEGISRFLVAWLARKKKLRKEERRLFSP